MKREVLEARGTKAEPSELARDGRESTRYALVDRLQQGVDVAIASAVTED